MGGEAGQALVSVLFVELDDTTCVVPATEIVSLDVSGLAGPRQQTRTVPLDPFLVPTFVSAGQKHSLMVRGTAGMTRFRTAARLALEEVEESAFYLLPGVMRGGGCHTWVRGLVRLPNRALGIWIDLSALADEVWPPPIEEVV